MRRQTTTEYKPFTYRLAAKEPVSILPAVEDEQLPATLRVQSAVKGPDNDTLTITAEGGATFTYTVPG